ncbi:MAG: NYN domain-containing protein [Planctomycetota bacterium]|nr:MAG: NYN domain-containing protein [Planctomycetota bacterium]
MTDPNVQRIALLLDYENIILGLPKQTKFQPQVILDRLLEYGNVVIKRAYSDFSGRDKDKIVLHELGFDLLDIPVRSMTGKNSADIRMVVDAMEMIILHPHLDTFALVTGDSDFTPLVSRLRAHDKRVIGFGVKSSSSKLLVMSCDEFVYYDELVDLGKRNKKLGEKLAKSAKMGRGADAQKRAEALYLVLDAARGLLRSRDMVWASMIKQTVVRKHPTFTESYHGYSSFSELMEDIIKLGILEGERDPKTGNYRVVGIGKAGRELAR